jgi:hypothetical protein
MQSRRYSICVLMKLEFFDRFSRNPDIRNFIKIRSVEAELFDTDGRTDRRYEGSNRFSEFCERTQ